MNCENPCPHCYWQPSPKAERVISREVEKMLPDYAGMWVVIEGNEIYAAADVLADLAIDWADNGGLLMWVPPKNMVMI